MKVIHSQSAPKGLSSRRSWAMTRFASRSGRILLPSGRFALGLSNPQARAVACEVALADARDPAVGCFARISVEAASRGDVFVELEHLPLGVGESNGAPECLFVISTTADDEVRITVYA
jgi:hypothetical protein